MLLLPSTARAQGFDPANLKPPPNLVVGVDLSVTMSVRPNAGCTSNNCHAGLWSGGGGPPASNFTLETGYANYNRLDEVKRRFIGTAAANYKDGAMSLYADKFVFGGFAFSGAKWAHVKDTIYGYGSIPGAGGVSGADRTVLPNANDVPGSYRATRNMIASLTPDYCVTSKNSPGCAELTLPGGVLSICMTPGDPPGCPGDQDILDDIMHGTGLPVGMSGSIFGSSPPLAGIPPIGTSTLCTFPVDTPSLITGGTDGIPDQCGAGKPENFPDGTGSGVCITGPLAPPPVPPQPNGRIDFMWEIIHEVVAYGGYTGFPRFTCSSQPGGCGCGAAGPGTGEINNTVCKPLGDGVRVAKRRLYNCLKDPQAWVNVGSCDSSCGNSNSGVSSVDTAYFSCNSDTLADNICCGSSRFLSTCVCNQNLAGCGATALDKCGLMMAVSGRIQSALCFADDPDAGFGAGPSPFLSTMGGQTANVLTGGCRSNALALITDGYYKTASIPGLTAHRALVRPVYKVPAPWSGPGVTIPQSYIFKAGANSGATGSYAPVNTGFDSSANIIQGYLTPVAPDLLDTPARPLLAPSAHSSRFEMAGAMQAMYNAQKYGTFSAANLGIDRHEMRVAMTSFDIPGIGPLGGMPHPQAVHYPSRPSRLSFFALDTAGAINPAPIFETDWAMLAGAGSCYKHSSDGESCFSSWLNYPIGSFRIRVPGGATIMKTLGGINPPAGTMDRNGNGNTADAIDTNPPAQGNGTGGAIASGNERRWGYMLGLGSSQPVIVEGPSDPATGARAERFSQWQNLTEGLIPNHKFPKERQRTIYVQSNTYLHAINGGLYDTGSAPPPRLGGRLTFDAGYREGGVPLADVAGKERWRYKPNFLNSSWMSEALPAGAASLVNAVRDIRNNDLTHVPLMSGQIVVREVETFGSTSPAGCATPASAAWFPGNTCPFRTILVMNQGLPGPGYAAIDVTNPLSPRPLWDKPLLYSGPTGFPGAPPAPAGSRRLALPGATSDPIIYRWPGNQATRPKAVIVVAGGHGGERALFAYDVVTGVQVASVGLPSAGSMESSDYRSVSCVDASGEGSITHCYALRADGRLIRAGKIAPGGFTGTVDVTPGYPGGTRTFWYRPIIFFDSDGKVNLVYGSGDILRMAKTPADTNGVWIVRDNFDGAPVYTSGAGTGPCRNNRPGYFPLPAGALVTSPPTVNRGIVAWTTYTPAADGCATGNSELYAVNHQTCLDIADNDTTPSVISSKPGIGLSPTVLRHSATILHHSSKDVEGGTLASAAATNAPGGDRRVIRKLYFRLGGLLK